MKLRIIAAFLFLITLVGLAPAQVIGRFAPKGTYTGESSQLISIARRSQAIRACYDQHLGANWDKPGVIVVEGEMDIDDGVLVTDNTGLDEDGVVKVIDTHQRGDDKAYLVRNTQTGQRCKIKSCGQPYGVPPPPDKLKIPFYETDKPSKIAFRIHAEANAEANANAISTATGGNAVAYNEAPKQPMGRRGLTKTGRETTHQGTVSEVARTSIKNSNVQTQKQLQDQEQIQKQRQEQDQRQQQQQEQIMQQMQEILNRLTGGTLAYLVPDSSGTIYLLLDSGRAAIAA